MDIDTVTSRRNEFDSHIWDHTDDLFQQQFDHRRPLISSEVRFLEEVVECLRREPDDQFLIQVLRKLLKQNPDGIFLFLQICGLTRNKIINDLKAIVRSTGSPHTVPAKQTHLPTRGIWELAGPYLAARLKATLEPLVSLDYAEPALQAVNQATWPGYIRQERAKRQGHEAERRIAELLLLLSIPFEPIDKADSPLSGDVQIEGISFDLVVPDTSNPRLCIKSTVQTANIGQFGESKAHLEIKQAKRSLRSKYSLNPPMLIAFIDGVGFHSNTAGLHGVLGSADEFAQFQTIWKVAVLAAHALDIIIDIAFPGNHQSQHSSFFTDYSEAINITGLESWNRGQLISYGFVQAGEAMVGQEGLIEMLEHEEIQCLERGC